MSGEARAEPVWMAGLGWLERNRAGFVLPAARPPELFRLKALGELAAIAEVLWRRADLGSEVRERIHALIEFAWTQLGEGEVLADFLAARPYPVLGTTYSVFERMGWRHEPTRQRLLELGQPGGLAALKKGPVSAAPPVAAQYGTDGVVVLCLGMALAWEVLRLPSPWQRARLYPNTSLAKRPAAAELGVPEANSLTHAVFFMTDWGADPQGLPAADRAYLAAHVPGWMDGFRACANFDLYAELAAVLCCVAESPLVDAEAVLRGAQQPDGAVPGPAERAAELTRDVDDPERRRFLSVYHTTLTAILASFALTVGFFRAGVPAAPVPRA